MKHLLALIFLPLLSLYTGHTAIAEPISATDLYKPSANPIVDLSPDGNRLLNYVRDDDAQSVDLIDLDTRKVVFQAPLQDDIYVHELAWLNNEYVYLSLFAHGNYAAKIGKFSSGKLTFKDLDKSLNILGIINSQDGALAASISRENGRVHKLAIATAEQLYELGIDSVEVIKPDVGPYTFFFYDQLSNSIIASAFDQKKKSIAIASLPIKDSKWYTVGELSLDEFTFIPVGFLTNTTLAVLTDSGASRIVLREYNLKTGEFGEILYQHAEYDLSGARISADGNIEYIAYEQHGIKMRDYLHSDSALLSKRFKKTFQNQEIYIADSSTTKDRLLLYVKGPEQAGEYLLYRKDKDELNPLFANFPNLGRYHFAPTQRVEATASDGKSIEGFLITPRKGQPNLDTLLVIPHGGPIGIRDSATFNPESQYFVSRGFSVLRVNFRGSFGYGSEFLEQGIGEFGKLIESDISTVVNHIQKTHRFKHACAMGASYGGYSSVMLAIKNPGLYRCIVGSFGVYDLPLLFNHSNHRVFHTEEIEAILGEYRHELRDVSPTYLSDKIQAPMLLIAGYNDPIARFEHSNRLKYLLKKKGKTVETLFYKNTGHGHKVSENRLLDLARSYTFILESLDLQLPEPAQLSAQGKSAIAEDLLSIAKSYDTNKYTQHDKDKADNYYQLAVKYGADISSKQGDTRPATP